MSVQALSKGPGGLPASFNWIGAALTVPPPTTPPQCTLGDFVWIDKNANGIQDDGPDSGVNGVLVELLDSTGKVVATTTTSIDAATGLPGFYSFRVDCGKTYRVRVAPSNFEPGKPLATCKTPTTQNATGSTTANDWNRAMRTRPRVMRRCRR